MIISKAWTLFLDRDGIINNQLEGGYIYKIEDFILKDYFIEGLRLLRPHFGRVIIVTNQQCVGKGICTSSEVDTIHAHLKKLLVENGISIDGIYYCPHLATDNCNCRKPNTRMAEMAKHDFPEIDFEKSIMVGDSLSDLFFGKRCGMKTAYIKSIFPLTNKEILDAADYSCENLLELSKLII